MILPLGQEEPTNPGLKNIFVRFHKHSLPMACLLWHLSEEICADPSLVL